MHKRKILFVIGAGASLEVGLPTGEQLKQEIGNLVNIRFHDGYSQNTGDHQIMESLRKHAHSGKTRVDVNEYMRAGWRIEAALPQALSIDNYIDVHRNDEKIKLCSKLGIAKAILKAERHSALHIDTSRQNSFNPAKLTSTWYHKFLQLLTERVAKEDLHSVFENVSVITFNYDRCVEQFLPVALANYYSISFEQAAEIVSTLKVLHPYGSIGRLPWQKDNRPLVPFGEEENCDLLAMSQEISTFTEQMTNADSLEEIHSTVAEAEIVVFLGFAFHSQNMELLTPQSDTAVQRVFATAIGISKADCEVVTKQIETTLRISNENSRIYLRSDLKCADLLSEYWRSLSSSY